MGGAKRLGKPPGSFPDDLEVAHNRIYRPIILQEGIPIEPGHEALDLLGRFPDVL
jgi:hypothetical protein